MAVLSSELQHVGIHAVKCAKVETRCLTVVENHLVPAWYCKQLVCFVAPKYAEQTLRHDIPRLTF